MRRTNIYLDEREIQAMDDLATARGISRAQIVRDLIDTGLVGGTGSTTQKAAIADSFAVLRDVEAPHRTDTERDAHLEDMWRL